MALTRKLLSSLGLEDSKIDSVIEAHIETVDGLKQQIEAFKGQLEAEKSEAEKVKAQLLQQIDAEKAKADTAKQKYKETLDAEKAETEKFRQQVEALQAEANKLTEVQAELDTLKSAPDYKAQYEAEKTAFEAYKLESESKAKMARVKAAYKDLLKAENVGAEQVDAILAVTDFTGMGMTEDGKLADTEKLTNDIKNRWGGFIVKTVVNPSDPPANPPKGNDNPFDTMSLSEKMVYANEHPTDPAVRAWLTK